MSKYTKDEQKFLDKAAIAYMQGKLYGARGITEDNVRDSYLVAKAMLTERKKLFGDEKRN